jgi:hypothetical protein
VWKEIIIATVERKFVIIESWYGGGGDKVWLVVGTDAAEYSRTARLCGELVHG